MVEMSVDEFVRKVTSGERNFEGIELPDGADLTPHIPELNEYAEKHPPEHYLSYFSPERCYLHLQNAILKGLRAPGICLVQTDLSGANLSRAFLRGVNLNFADLTGANLYQVRLDKAYLGGANLEGAILGEAELYDTNLLGANLREVFLMGANLGGARLDKADLRGAKHLDACQNLKYALLEETKVTIKEQEIIEKARKELILYKLMSE